MRVLVGNHIDASIRVSGDMSAKAQRILWFARDNDVIVLPSQPDREFVGYVEGLTGVDTGTLRFHVPPPGPLGGRLLDTHGLTDPAFLRAVAADLGDVSEIFALWPSAGVARFAAALGLTDRLPGAEFIAQGGGEWANSKACFRALAAGARAPIASGAVCHSLAEATTALTELIERAGAAVVKQAHNGSGNGNQVVLTNETVQTGHVGATHLHVLEPGPGAVQRYWARQWMWASADGRFPVVVEEFVPNAMSVYSEHCATDDGVTPTGAGVLDYVDRRLAAQLVPLRRNDIGERAYESLIDGGTRLAEVYRSLGYRGYLSADAIVDPAGGIRFTEVNAQVSGSLHLYDVIANRVVGVATAPERTVAEYDVPLTWGVTRIEDFLARAGEAGCLFDPATRTGVIVSTPPLLTGSGQAEFMFCIAFDTEDRWPDLYRRLERAFADATRKVPA